MPLFSVGQLVECDLLRDLTWPDYRSPTIARQTIAIIASIYEVPLVNSCDYNDEDPFFGWRKGNWYLVLASVGFGWVHGSSIQLLS